MLIYKMHRWSLAAGKSLAMAFTLLFVVISAAGLERPVNAEVLDSSSFDFVELPSSPAREGYLTLTWSEFEGAASYRVVNGDGKVVHSGIFPQAFISGLSDGEYRYRVQVIGDSGEVLAESASVASVEVKHWPGIYVWPLLGIGFVVVAAVVGVIVAGERWAKADEVAA